MSGTPSHPTISITLTIAGVQHAFRDDQALEASFGQHIRIGMPVRLAHDENNPVDRYAISATCVVDDSVQHHHIGCVSADYLGRTHALLKNRTSLTGRVAGWKALTGHEKEHPVATVFIDVDADEETASLDRERDLMTTFTPCQHVIPQASIKPEETCLDALCDDIRATPVGSAHMVDLLKAYQQTIDTSLAFNARLHFLYIEAHIRQINDPDIQALWADIAHKHHNCTSTRSALAAYRDMMAYVKQQGVVENFAKMYPHADERQDIQRHVRETLYKQFGNSCLPDKEGKFAQCLWYGRFSRTDLYNISVHKLLFEASLAVNDVPTQTTATLSDASTPNPQPLAFEQLSEYFKPKYRGIDAPINYLQRLIDDLGKASSARQFAMVALIAYKSESMNTPRKPEDFNKWYKILCEAIDQSKFNKYYKPSKFKEIPEELQKKFDYLN